MKAAIITYHRSYNYGSALQAYALNKTLNDLGVETHTIDYITERQKNIYKHFQRNNSLMNIIRNVYTLRYLKLLKLKYNRFDDFIKTYIRTTSKIYTLPNQLIELNNKYDLFVCGSDQIWNPNTADFDESYLLSFVKDKRKCFSFAPSIGVSSHIHNYENLFKKYLKDFRSLSVREKTAASYLTKLLNRKVVQVLDPVFLRNCNEWQQLAKDSYKNKYIFCYFIGDVPYMRDFAKQMHKETGLDLVVVYKNLRDILYTNVKFYDAGPQEFLNLVKNATYVVTNSFHAVSFSLLFKKNFWAFIDRYNNVAPNSRIVDLLTHFDLQNRIYKKDNTFDKYKSIEYTSNFEEKLKRDIEFSISYLKNAIWGNNDKTLF